jgi:hypothetical protein
MMDMKGLKGEFKMSIRGRVPLQHAMAAATILALF